MYKLTLKYLAGYDGLHFGICCCITVFPVAGSGVQVEFIPVWPPAGTALAVHPGFRLPVLAGDSDRCVFVMAFSGFPVTTAPGIRCGHWEGWGLGLPIRYDAWERSIARSTVSGSDRNSWPRPPFGAAILGAMFGVAC